MGFGGAGPQRTRREKSREQGREKSRHQGGLCAIARIETLSGLEEEALALLADMAFAVRAEEDACVSYAVTRVLGSPTHIAVHARFADWQAFKDHAETAHMDRLLPRLNPLLAAPIALEVFLEV